MITNLGEEWVVDKLNETVQTLGAFVAWGTGVGTAAKADTTLFTEASEARVTGTTSKTGAGATAKYQILGTLTADAAKTITNMGTFLVSVAGTLIVHHDHAGVALALGDKIEYLVTIDPA